MTDDKVRNLEKLMDDIEIEAETIDVDTSEGRDLLHELRNRYMKVNAEYFVQTGRLYEVESTKAP